MKLSIIAFLAHVIIKLLRFTWRIVFIGPTPDYQKGPIIFCFWHGKQAGLLAHPRPRPVTVMSSLSKDGSLQAKILSSLGFVVHRGSSSKGGSKGLSAMVKQVRSGCDAALTVDGPRGPLHQAKPGALFLGSQSGGTIVPITAHARFGFVFKKTWDQYLLPLPFSKVFLITGTPLNPTQTTPEELTQALLNLDHFAKGL